MPKNTDNVTAAIRYNFYAPINLAEEEYNEYFELSKELEREIDKKVDNILP